MKDPSKEVAKPRTPIAAPRAKPPSTSRDLQSIERETGKTPKPLKTTKNSPYLKTEKNPPAPKINVKGSGEPNSAQTRVAANSYSGRLKQKGTRGKNY